MYKAVVFDMDGVLYDTEVISRKCWFQTAEEWHLENMPSVFPKCIGLNRNDGNKVLKEAYGADFDGMAFMDACAEKFQFRLRTDGLPLKKGVREILAWLNQEKILAAICSSSRCLSIQEHLRDTQMEGCFDQIIGGDLVEHSKPLPDIYLKACAALGIKPEDCIGVEDSPNGLRSCHAAGLQTVMVPDLIPPSEELMKLCFMKADSLLDLLEYLKQNRSYC